MLIGSQASGLLSAAVVTLAEESGVDARTFTPADIYATALHELGHALGLAHRERQSSVMSPRVRDARIIALDRAVLLVARSAVRTRLRGGRKAIGTQTSCE